MVKGTSKQVILVRSPDPELFEQAIFILRDDALGREGVSDRAILRQARQAAMGFVPKERKGSRLRPPLWVAFGALATAAVWLITTIV